jgi:hypothetical protein
MCHQHAAPGQLHRQRPHRQVGLLGQPRQKPASGLTCQNAGAVTANLARNLPATRALTLADPHG